MSRTILWRRGQAFVSICICALIGVLLFLPHPSGAEQLREGWISKAGTQNPTFIYGNEEAVIMTVMVGPDEMANPASLLKKMDAPGVCPGLSASSYSAVENGTVLIAKMLDGPVECAVVIRKVEKSGVMLVAIQPKGSKADAIDYAISVARPEGSAEPKKAEQSAQVSLQPSGSIASEAELKRMINTVPVANRPIGFMLIWSSKLVGTQLLMVKDPWMVFGNGYATDCYAWDPRTTSPTPQSLDTKSCSVLKWRKTGKQIQTQDEDGSWNDAEDLSQGYTFKAGERVAYSVEGWNAVGGPIIGGSSMIMPYASVSVDRVFMEKDGSIVFGASKKELDSANTTVTSSGVRGNYYVDKYLMAVGMEGGAKRLHFVINMDELLVLDGQILGASK